MTTSVTVTAENSKYLGLLRQGKHLGSRVVMLIMVVLVRQEVGMAERESSGLVRLEGVCLALVF